MSSAASSRGVATVPPTAAAILATVVLAAAAGTPLGPATVAAQTPAVAGGDWNGPAVLELVERARTARSTLAAAGDLRSYTARTEGHVYFFLDPDVGERTLIRIDQVAVELSWQAPDQVRQRIVGERSETLLPVQDFRYYTDRLTLVQYGLGDEIRVGSGLDVTGVPHPFAPVRGGGPVYDYRLGDSLSLVLPGRPEPVRLQEIEVRPRDEGAPGAIGSVTVDRATGGIVRMAITFTPASYVDPRSDRISVELDYGLWEGRYWLPNVQKVEVRREWPAVDIGVGTVIRAVLRTGDYRLNEPVSPVAMARPPISAVPAPERAAYPFPEGLYDGIERDGLREVVLAPDVERLRARAYELIEEGRISGLSPLRLHLPSVSSLLRYSRAEGLVAGGGLSFRPGGPLEIRLRAGFGFGDERPRADLGLRAPLSDAVALEAHAVLRETRDLGLTPASDALLSSFGTLLLAEDWRDPYFASGGRLALVGTPGARSRLSLEVGADRIESGRLEVARPPLAGDREPRPVRAVRPGTFLTAAAEVRRSPAWTGVPRSSLEAAAGFAIGEEGRGGSLLLGAEARFGPPSRARELRLAASHWSWWGDALPQGHRLLGGRGTLPGYRFRSFAGREVGTLEAEASWDLWRKLVRLRAGLHAGWASNPDPSLAALWVVAPTRGVRVSASVGAGFAWDILRLDLARGFDGDEWQLILSVDPAWWGYL